VSRDPNFDYPNIVWKLEIPIKKLFFCFFMRCMFPAPLAEFFEFQFAFNLADIFVAPIVEPLALGALHAD